MIYESDWGGDGYVWFFIDDEVIIDMELFLEWFEIIYGLVFYFDFVCNGLVFVGCNGYLDRFNEVCICVLCF